MKIYCYGDDCSKICMSIKVIYGWQGEMYTDIIQLNYNGLKREALLTVKALNSGVGMVVESIIDIIKSIDLSNISFKNPFKVIVERLSQKIGMNYNEEIMDDVFQKHQTFLNKLV